MAGDWRKAARGIPVWEGCASLVQHGGCGAWVRYRAEHDAEEGVIPDLANADTRAAYIPRLAVARGAPEEATRRGWRLMLPERWPGDDAWTEGYLTAGHGDWGTTLRLPPEVPHDTPDLDLLVLALAWPADKRVTG